MLGFFEDHTIDQIYAYEMMQKFAFSLIGIFIPVYIASNGFALQSVFLYLAAMTSSYLVFSIPVSYIISRIGFKHSLVLSYLFYLPAFIGLRAVPLSTALIVGAGAFLGVGKAFHWISLNAEFAIDSEEDSRGKASGRLLGLPRLSRALAPFLGGVVMTVYGFPALVSVAILFVFLSALPLLASKDHRDPLEYGLRSLLNRKHAVFASLFTIRGMTIATGKYIFPLFVFYIVGSTVDVGSVQSLASLGSVFFTLFVGRISDRVERRHMIAVGAVASGVLFAVRGSVNVPVEAFIVSFVSGLMFMLYYVPLFSGLADQAEEEDILEFYAFREFFLATGRLLVYGLVVFVALSSSTAAGFKAAFYVTGAATLLLPFFTRVIEE